MKRFFSTLIFFWIVQMAWAQLPVPAHNGRWVHDEAGVLSQETVMQLEGALKAHRDSTSTQIAILIVRSLEGASIEDYTLRVAEAWQIGQKGKDNGVLLFISIDDRQIRTEVGYGLEGVLTDAMSSRINRNEIAPYFKQGNYDDGVKAGVIAIIKTIQGTYTNDDPAPARKKKGGRSPLGTIIFFIILIIIFSRRGGGGGMGGFLTGAMLGSMMGGNRGHYGGSSGSWSSGDFGGGGGFGGGGSSDSW